jgi:hypothetical protein
MIVLLIAYLYEGEPPAGDDSDIRDFRIEFFVDTMVRVVNCEVEGKQTMMAVFHCSVFECS